MSDTPPYTHALVSRMNSWLGRGGRRKFVGRIARPITEMMSGGSSWTVTPPVSLDASSFAGIAVIQSTISRENSSVTSSGRSRRVSTHSRASSDSSVSVSRSWNSSTSTLRRRITSTNASNSSCARLTQITSSNSSAWQFPGDSRSCARSGRCTITVRSVPTSELAPTARAVAVSMLISFLRLVLAAAESRREPLRASPDWGEPRWGVTRSG